jgi:hypothetical protein
MVSSKRASLGRLRHSVRHPLPNGTMVARCEERPLRHPDSPAKKRRGGVEEKSAKANPFEQSNRIAK